MRLLGARAPCVASKENCAYNSGVAKYWPLIKSLQTGLLLATGLAGFMSARSPVFNLPAILSLAGSLFLAIAGSTVLNMWYDRDIDAVMKRTCWRPLPTRLITPPQALAFGLLLSVFGVGWALVIDLQYGAVVYAGLFLDVVVYTLWLKRRTCWSIAWGGLSGAMPILGGRVLGVGELDWIGVCLALAVLFWIPTHTLTFSMKFLEDYQAARVPTFPSSYGFRVTRHVIALSSLLAAAAMTISVLGIGMAWGYLNLLAVLTAGLLLLALRSSLRPSERVNFVLFRYASLYMAAAMLLIVLDVI